MSKDRDTDPVHLWLLLWKAAQSVAAHARRHIEGLGMCPSDFAVLEALLHKGPQPVQALGRRVLLTSGSMTAAVDRLTARGLAERREDAADRRARIVALTPAGEMLIREAFAEHARVMERATAALGREERAELAGLLRRLGRGAVAALPQESAPSPIRQEESR